DHSFWIGMGGTVTFAVSAVDTALWDLASKLAGLPVHRLLGGKLHDRVRACASVIWDPGDSDATAAEFADYRARGFTWIKGGWGRHHPDRPGPGRGTHRHEADRRRRALRARPVRAAFVVERDQHRRRAARLRVEPERRRLRDQADPFTDAARARATAVRPGRR